MSGFNRILVFNNQSSYSDRVKRELLGIIRASGKTVDDSNPDVVVAIGGDGTMLSAIRKYRHFGIPFIGIDTGTLGFLNTIMPENLETIVDVFEQKNFRVEKYPTIAVKMSTVDGTTIEDYAFNEAIIRHYEPRLLHSKIYINGYPFNYFTGDGLVISTPIGATGYAIWTGGAVVHTDLSAYQITPLAPNDNSVNRPMSASMVIPASTKIDIEVMDADRKKVAVSVDGNHCTDKFVTKTQISLDMDRPVEIIRSDNYDYIDLFRRKIIDKDIRRKLAD